MKKNLIIIVAVIILIAFIAMIIGVIKQRNAIEQAQQQTEETTEETTTPEETITLKHQYKDGIHVFVGEIETPNSCYQVDAQIIPGDTAELAITIKEPAADAVCAQVITPMPYRVELEAPETQPFIATVNGVVVNMNQYEVPAAQDIDSVDIYSKG